MRLSNRSLLKNSQYLIWILSYAKPFTVEIWLEINSGHLEKNSGKRIGVSEIMWCRWGKNPLWNILKTIALNKIKPFGAPFRRFFRTKSSQMATTLFCSKVIILLLTVIAEIFNAYFSSIASEIGFNNEHATPDEAISAYHNHSSIVKIRDAYGDSMQSFNFQTVNHNCVARKLQMINIRKATGYDNIPAKLLRLAQNELTHPIANLINNTMAMNTFPDQLKCAELSPLFKKEDNLNKTNFRPVSILTGISKLYESVVNDQLLEYFSRLFNDLISAYRKGYSCQSLLVKCIDTGKNALDKQQHIGALFMDLSKAFDCLPHGLIIAKLHAYGLELPACKLLFSYLRGRKQRVKISNSRSSWAVLTKGVPQGSILGPLPT